VKTEYANIINSKPVIFLSLKNCNGDNKKELMRSFKVVFKEEFEKYYRIFKENNVDLSSAGYEDFVLYYDVLRKRNLEIDYDELKDCLKYALFFLSKALYEYYSSKVIIILDEYDNPFIEAKNGGYYDEAKGFLSSFFVTTFKGNMYLEKSIMTGIQRIAHESIFSKFNNPKISTVVDEDYSDKFGLTEGETRNYLNYFGLELTKEVKDFYNGYKFYETNVYNPMSITNYISENGKLFSYWVNTSANTLVKEEIQKADDSFFEKFEELIEKKTCTVKIKFATTFMEKQTSTTLWGLLVNAGYVTVDKILPRDKYKLRIPNEEFKTEFQNIVANYTKIGENVLADMFDALLDKDIDEFIKTYKNVVLKSTSYYDATLKENSYHMLMLGMCIYLEPQYEVQSNVENGMGRSDIIIKATNKEDISVVIEFKYLIDEDDSLEKSAKEALKQIQDNKYYCKLKGQVLLLGVAHNKKQVDIAHEMINV